MSSITIITSSFILFNEPSFVVLFYPRSRKIMLVSSGKKGEKVLFFTNLTPSNDGKGNLWLNIY